MTTNNQFSQPELEQFIADEFGANASYVSELLRQFEVNPVSVDEEWRAYFDEMLGNPPPSLEQPPVLPDQEREAPVEVPLPEAPSAAAGAARDATEHVVIRGAALRIAENMESSLAVPTATSQREMPLKLLEENRRLINEHLSGRRKVSFTHLIAHAILKAFERFPQINDSYEEVGGTSYRVRHEHVNFGIAVDVTRKDGTRLLLVPNIKAAEKLTFSELLDAYDDIVRRAREGKLQTSDLTGTTITLTNPGTLGTTASNPRLMAGQSLIVATGVIEYPPEYHAMASETLSRLGISKIMTIGSTYDHRIIQGAESGGFLALIDEMLRGEQNFYDEIFASLNIPYRPYRWAIDVNPAIMGEERRRDEVHKQARVLELINAYRVRGHLIADVDPLGWKTVQYHKELDIETYGLTIWDLDRQFITGGLGGNNSATLREIVALLRRFYCGKVGVEYRHIQGPEEKEWIRARVETDAPAVPEEARKQILWKLISAELFEKFLGTKYLGQKRFSIEGNETVIALLDQLIECAASRGVQDITIGMAHRGRLNVIANVIGRFCERIFTIFEGSIHPSFPHDQGDVKYHQGASGIRDTSSGRQVSLTVAPNPSHLEFVDPVIEGMVRAKQEASSEPANLLAVLLHGDAAFAGEGVVAETLNFSQLPGYTTGGTIHIIVNNQLGFTTSPEEGRSSTYSTDIAKMVQAPIFHVNSDEPDAAFQVLQVALDYRRAFNKDVVIDVIGFRRHGHNEGDEPTYTQPLMYHKIRLHPGVRELYARRLIGESVMRENEVSDLINERNRRYENALLGAKEIVSRQGSEFDHPPAVGEPESVEPAETGVDQQTLGMIAQTVTTVPREFNLNPKIVGLLARRGKMVEGSVPVDWGMAEALAFGSLLVEGTNVRIAGQDTVRGTFSHRHAAFADTATGVEWAPLAGLGTNRARFQIYDSPLSETGVLGFEYGYSVASPESLVIWEAQFGDFVNAAQVIIDQFIASGEEKWNQTSRVVLLLPHGYEGQGPEHSSARLERFLQLCAGGNMQVVNCSTAAQYFHILRRQVRQLASKPLVVMSPKSLLRVPEASSPIEEFTGGSFNAVLRDDTITARAGVRCVLLCSGKVYYDLAAERRKSGNEQTPILRLEQLYPFPAKQLGELLAGYPKAVDFCWVQEEPANMGGWYFVEPRILRLLGPGQSLRYAGRPTSSSTATGSHTIHQMEQRRLVNQAFGQESAD